MSNLTVFNHGGQLYTDSRQVAKMIGKSHAHLMRDITGYIETLSQSKIGFAEFFKESSYLDAQKKSRLCYSITKKGCEFVANKLTGEKGVIFTASYVNAFHYMEDKLSGKLPTKSSPKKFSLASFNHLMEINIRQMKAANQPATHIASWTNGMTRDVLSPFGINVPALPDAVPTTYDATEMAKKIGVYSKSGKPHPQVITAIIKEVGIHQGETFTTETTAHEGRKDVPDVRYAESVCGKVRGWLVTHDNPNPVALGGKNYSVVYRPGGRQKMTEIPIPECVADKLLRLNQLAEQYPGSIPIKAVSEFLGCDGQSVRAYLMMPNSFGMGWIKDGKANRGFFIPTAKFYIWYRNLLARGA